MAACVHSLMKLSALRLWKGHMQYFPKWNPRGDIQDKLPLSVSKLSSSYKYKGEFKKRYKELIGKRGCPKRMLKTKSGALIRPYNYRYEYMKRYGEDVPNAIVWDIREYQERMFRAERKDTQKKFSNPNFIAPLKNNILDKQI